MTVFDKTMLLNKYFCDSSSYVSLWVSITFTTWKARRCEPEELQGDKVPEEVRHTRH